MIKQTGVLVCFIAFISTTQAAQAPASQPSKNGVSVTCNDEWNQGPGKEAECRVDTGNAIWNLRYYREGTEKLNLKGLVKNLIVLFPPRGYNHLVQQWWGDLVGPNKPINTNDWVVLSLGTPGDTMPQETSPIYLNHDEILTAQKAIIDRLFPKRKPFLLGGASLGGGVSWFYSMKFPEDAWGSIHLAANLVPPPANTVFSDMMRKLEELEKERGPYGLWDLQKKKDLWLIVAWDDVKDAPESYYENPQNMKDFDQDPKSWKSAKQFKEFVANNWAESYAKHSDPFWMEAQEKSWDRAIREVKEKDYIKMPEKMLIVYNVKDIGTPREAMNEFFKVIQKNRPHVKLTTLEIDDPQGHGFCYAPKMRDDVKVAIHKFLD